MKKTKEMYNKKTAKTFLNHTSHIPLRTSNKGITLIALVITIIVMLILVAVTISMAVNGGLFEYAGNAVGDTNKAMQDEQQLGSGKVTIDNKVYNSIDEYLNSKNKVEGVDLSLLKLGDYVKYPVEYTNVADSYNKNTGEEGDYPSDEFTGWRIFSKETDEEGNILYIKLISAGVPLSYYHYDDTNTSIQALTTNFLTTEITNTLTQYKFFRCGFKNVIGDKLESTFSNKFTDQVQSATWEEFDAAAWKIMTPYMYTYNYAEYNHLFAIPLKESTGNAFLLFASGWDGRTKSFKL